MSSIPDFYQYCVQLLSVVNFESWTWNRASQT